MSQINSKIEVPDSVIQDLKREFENLLDDATMLQIHNELARYCDPYVPFFEGVLSQTVEITSDGVTYIQPYARYQYYGEIYGPNIPIKDETGQVIGWFSPPGQPKHPTGRMMSHTTDLHPLASSKWDEAMLRDRGEDFAKQVGAILERRIKGYGSG